MKSIHGPNGGHPPIPPNPPDPPATSPADQSIHTHEPPKISLATSIKTLQLLTCSQPDLNWVNEKRLLRAKQRCLAPCPIRFAGNALSGCCSPAGGRSLHPTQSRPSSSLSAPPLQHAIQTLQPHPYSSCAALRTVSATSPRLSSVSRADPALPPWMEERMNWLNLAKAYYDIPLCLDMAAVIDQDFSITVFVRYEKISKICTYCAGFFHNSSNCQIRKNLILPTTNCGKYEKISFQIYGPWMTHLSGMPIQHIRTQLNPLVNTRSTTSALLQLRLDFVALSTAGNWSNSRRPRANPVHTQQPTVHPDDGANGPAPRNSKQDSALL